MRISFVGATISFILVPTLALAQTAPSVEEVYENPQKYAGKTLVFTGIQLSGNYVTNPGRYRFTVKTATGKVIDPEIAPGRITFVTPRKYGDSFVEKLHSGKSYLVELTCTVARRQARGTTVFIAQIKNAKFVGTLIEYPKPDDPNAKPPRIGEPPDWSIQQLVQYYDPDESENKIGRELDKRSKGKRFIVLRKDHSVDIKWSLLLLTELKKGFPEREWIDTGGTLCKTYRVGEDPEELLDENPLYPGESLRLDGTCDHTKRKWEGVPLVVRQVLYLALTDTKELTIERIADAQYVMDQVAGKEPAVSVKWVKTRYPLAYIAYGEKKERNQLPILKISPPIQASPADPKQSTSQENSVPKPPAPQPAR